MLTLRMSGHSFRFEIENICRLFLPQEKVTVADELPKEALGVLVDTCLEKGADTTVATVAVTLDDFAERETAVIDNAHPAYRSECELMLATLLYRLFVRLFGIEQTWGIVTGVRPIKLLRHLAQQSGEQAALAHFRDRLLVSERKLELCRHTLSVENDLLALSRPDSFSLYISIPFCPTRCDYCSFVSHTVERAAALIPVYVENLLKEIAYTGDLANRLGLRLETVYIGGGTPTTLSADQLARIFETVAAHFDLSHLREFTVEAGRPDTVTADKFHAMKAAGVTRISINPQTLQDHVLQGIGRKHTAAQFYEAFTIARACGMDNINTDLIAGLPGDDVDGFRQTLDGILALSPESITVHTLSMKRASNISIQHRADYTVKDDAVQMVAHTAEALPQAGYHPYYLYRQSRTVGNQENVGWAKPGCEGLYNVYIMDETHTILACGAGAVTKLKRPNSTYLERIFNYKFPYEYNADLDEMLRRKQRVITFYEECANLAGDQPPR